jgi:hypothetical protein
MPATPAIVIAVCVLVGAVVYFWAMRRGRLPGHPTEDAQARETARLVAAQPTLAASPLDAGAEDVAFPAPGQTGEDAEPADSTVEHRLDELADLKQRGQITAEEYENRKRHLMK